VPGGLAFGIRFRGIAEAQDRLQRIPPLIRQAFRNELTVGFEQAHTWMVENTLTGGTTPMRLKVFTGNFVASLRVRITEEPGGIVRGELAQDQRYRSAVYGPIHEFGGVIRPRFAKALARPMNAEARSYESPRDFPEPLWFLERQRGDQVGFLMATDGAGNAVAMWQLLSKVVIPARRPFGQTADVYLPIIWERVAGAIERVVAEGRA